MCVCVCVCVRVCVCVPSGNHDWGTHTRRDLSAYLDYMPVQRRRFYDVRIGPVHLFSLDSERRVNARYDRAHTHTHAHTHEHRRRCRRKHRDTQRSINPHTCGVKHAWHGSVAVCLLCMCMCAGRI